MRLSGEAFLAAWSGSISGEPCDAVAATLDEIWAAARAAWPAVALPCEAFVAALAAHAPADRAPSDALRALRADDLYLATACGRGDRAALAAFEVLMLDAEAALRRLRLLPGEIADLLQSLRVRLFVGGPGGRGKIDSYAARGSLRSWLYTAAAHHGLNYLEGRRHDPPLSDEILTRVGSTGSPELDYIKTTYRAQFREAFHAALSALARDDRTLLAHYYIDGLSMEELSALRGIHRVTIGRRLTRAREAVFAGTIATLRTRLDVDSRELDSILRLINSQLDFSIGALLHE
jgi:RNA polymerase sigma-70 factor (ECF subfamily)